MLARINNPHGKNGEVMTYEDAGFIILISQYGWESAVDAIRRARCWNKSVEAFAKTEEGKHFQLLNGKVDSNE